MSIISNAKEIADLVKKMGDIDLYRKIVELESEIIETTRENLELKKELEELRTINDKKMTIEYRSPFYYMEGDEIPICPKCWEVNNITVHLVDLKTMGSPLQCKECESRYNKD